MNEIKSEVLKYIQSNPGTSYVEIERLFEAKEFDYNGSFDICSNQNKNIVFWSGWNTEAINVLSELKREMKIIEKAASQLIYFIDGKVLDLPLVTGAYNYKTRHWLPITFNVV